MDKNELLEIAELINKNISKYGLERYDLRDTRWIPFLLKKNTINSLIRKCVLLCEEFTPIFVRKVLGIKKKCWPTTYTFLGNSYLLASANNINISFVYTDKDLIELCLQEYIYPFDKESWWKDEPHIGLHNFTIDVGEKTPTLLMHALTRCNIFLLNYGLKKNNIKYVEIAVESALFVLKHYQVIDFQDGTKSISYFYNSYDCTININSEFSHWLSLIPLKMHNEKTLDMLYSMIRLLIKEQNDDGSWYYFSKWHIKKYKENHSCDCHHTATVLYNIVNIIQCNYLDREVKDLLCKSLDKGMQFFINSFFDYNSGKAKTLIGYSRPAGPVQYSESIFAFCDYLEYYYENKTELWYKIKELLPKVVDQAASLINQKNGSVPSEKIIKWKNMNSIRWGNGPILQAIISYLSLYDKIYGDFYKEMNAI